MTFLSKSQKQNTIPVYELWNARKIMKRVENILTNRSQLIYSLRQIYVFFKIGHSCIVHMRCLRIITYLMNGPNLIA